MSTAESQRRWRANHGARSGVRGRRPSSPCGTLAAHKRHVRHGEEPCELCRLAARADRQFRRTRGKWQRSDRFAWLLHRAVLDQLLAVPEPTISAALGRLYSQRERAGAGEEQPLWDQWDSLLNGPMFELASVMIGHDEASKQLRSTTPFVGILSEDRRSAALEASRAA